MRRLRLTWLLLSISLLLVLVPLAVLVMLRVPESELARRTQAELLAQGAVVASTYRVALGYREQESVEPMTPLLDVSAVDILPEPEDLLGGVRPERPSAAAGAAVQPILRQAAASTLAAIHVVDAHGVVVASSREALYDSLADRQEVQRALTGRPTAVLRNRNVKGRDFGLSTVSRNTRVRVHVAFPILAGGQVVGAVVLSRTPISLVQATYQHRGNLALAAMVILGLAAMIGLLISIVMRRSFRALVTQSRGIAAGRPEARAPLEHSLMREVTEVSEALVQMADALQERGEYLSTFASNVSHALKTPLTSVRGALELLGDHLDSMSEEEQRHFLDIAERDTARMQRMVRRLLELARADTHSPHASATPVEPLLRNLSQVFGADVEVVKPEPLRALVADQLAAALLFYRSRSLEVDA